MGDHHTENQPALPQTGPTGQLPSDLTGKAPATDNSKADKGHADIQPLPWQPWMGQPGTNPTLARTSVTAVTPDGTPLPGGTLTDATALPGSQQPPPLDSAAPNALPADASVGTAQSVNQPGTGTADQLTRAAQWFAAGVAEHLAAGQVPGGALASTATDAVVAAQADHTQQLFYGAGAAAASVILSVQGAAEMIGGAGATAVTDGAAAPVAMPVLAHAANVIATAVESAGAGATMMMSAGGGDTSGPPSPGSPEPRTLLEHAMKEGVRDEIPEGRIEVFAHGAPESFVKDAVDTGGNGLSPTGGNHGGQLHTLPNIEQAGVFAQRAAANAGEQPAILGIALPESLAKTLRAEGLLRLGPVDNPPLGIPSGTQQWVFQPGAIEILQKRAFFFRIR